MRMITKGILALLAIAAPALANAEATKVRLAKQYGLGFLPIMVLESEGFFEKRAKEAGLDIEAEWMTLGGPAAANEALLADNVDIIANGPPSFLVMWDRTRGTAMSIRGITPISTLPMWLNTRNPEIKSLEDFTSSDRIAVTAIKTSIPSIIMQMYAAEKYGIENYEKFDALTTSLPHPDGMAALLSNTEITGHFTSPPYQYLELEKDGISRVATSYELMGGAATFTLFFGKDSFIDANPKAIDALVLAMQDAQNFIKDNPETVAKLYVERSGEGGIDTEGVMKILADPDVEFTSTPLSFMKYAEFMNKVGTLKATPAAWTDLFVQQIHQLPGN